MAAYNNVNELLIAPFLTSMLGSLMGTTKQKMVGSLDPSSTCFAKYSHYTKKVGDNDPYWP